MAEQLRDNLRQMVQDTESRIERLRRGADSAEAAGNTEGASARRREQAAFEETLQATRESLRQAEEVIVDVHKAKARLDAFLVREAARWNL